MHKITYTSLLFLFKISAAVANTYAYVTNAETPGHISICKINPDTGQFEYCNNSQLDSLSAPLDIAFATVADTTYAYISNNNYPAFVTRCMVKNNNILQDCMATDVPSHTGIALHQSNQLYAYLGYSASVQKCAIMPNGQLQNLYCSDSGAGNLFLNGPVYITFQAFNNITYAYIANGDYKPNASVFQCRVQNNGSFTNCINAAVGYYFNGAADVAFATIHAKTYGYITESGGAIIKCEVDTNNGLFKNCTVTDGNFNTPVGMIVAKIANTLYAYIVDGGFDHPYQNTVSQCTINDTGDLDCVDSGVGNIFANPFGIAMIAQES